MKASRQSRIIRFSTLCALCLLATLITAHAHAESSSAGLRIRKLLPRPVGVLTFPPASLDTFVLYGGPGSLLGKFQTVAQQPDFQGWTGLDRTENGGGIVAGDFSKVFTMLSETDPYRANTTPVIGFIDDGTPPSNSPLSTGGSTSGSWSYGTPGGWVVNYTDGVSGGLCPLDNEVVSPPIAWDLAGPSDDDAYIGGTIVNFRLWRHVPWENGIYYQWHIRSSNDNGVSWSNWRNRGHVYYGRGSGEWMPMTLDVTTLVPNDRTHVQVALGVVDLAAAFGLPGNDATPSPAFDDVTIAKYRVGGPAISYRVADLFQDAFPQSGSIAVGTQMERDALDVRIDAAIDVNSGAAYMPGDSLVIMVSSAINGVAISNPTTQIEMRWILDVNPLFEMAIRDNIFGTPQQGVHPLGWDQYKGSVPATQATTGAGVPVPDTYFFDLPDVDFMYPGDQLRYYIYAEDDLGNVTTLPTDVTGFNKSGSDRSSSSFDKSDSYNSTFSMSADPTITDTSGTQPEILFVNDFGLRPENAAVWSLAFDQLGLNPAVHYDTFEVKATTSCLGNVLGASATGGATAEQISGYSVILYETGDLMDCLLTEADMTLIELWHDETGDRGIVYFGENLASALDDPAGLAFVQNVMGVDVVDNDVSDEIAGQMAPSVEPQVVDFAEGYFINGGPPDIHAIDSLLPTAGSFRAHGFTSPGGGPVYPPSASVVFDRLDTSGDREVDLTFPFGFGMIADELGSSPVSARSILLDEILSYLWGVTPAADTPVSVDEPGLARISGLNIYPNPSNPAVQIRFRLDLATRVVVRILDPRGREVTRLHAGAMEAGENRLTWHGSDATGTQVASGVYFANILTPFETLTRKVVLLR